MAVVGTAHAKLAPTQARKRCKYPQTESADPDGYLLVASMRILNTESQSIRELKYMYALSKYTCVTRIR